MDDCLFCAAGCIGVSVVTSEIKEKAFKGCQKELVEQWGSAVRQEALGGDPLEDGEEEDEATA
jgi:hypothetical protein